MILLLTEIAIRSIWFITKNTIYYTYNGIQYLHTNLTNKDKNNLDNQASTTNHININNKLEIEIQELKKQICELNELKTKLIN